MVQSDMADLRQILRAERECLQSGAFDQLGELGYRKRAALELIEIQPMVLEELRQTQRLAQENQHLIHAALQGIRSAQARLRSIRLAENGMTSYTAQGNSLRLGQDSAHVEKRA